MVFVIGLLTALMVVDCVILILLVLMQLPKKEAGAGLAFGGAATDALFGAGSGNFLTKATKYAAGFFFGFAILLSMLQMRHYRGDNSDFRRALDQPVKSGPVASPGAPVAGAAAPAVAPMPGTVGNTSLLMLPPMETTAATNSGVATNSVPPK